MFHKFTLKFQNYMYPKISDLLLDLFGIDIPLPIQSYGFMVAVALIVGAFFLSKEFYRKEKEGLFKVIVQKIKVGEPASIQSIAISSVFGFVIGYKVFYIILNYSDFVKRLKAHLKRLDILDVNYRPLD